jgi:arylsulfatase A-like enzyme
MDMPKGQNKARVDYSGLIENGPNQYGFDYFYGISASLDFPPYVYIENNRFTEQASVQVKASPFPAYSRAGEQGPTFKHIEALDHLTAKATEYLTTRSKTDTPFFLYFPLTSPHKPVLPAPRFRGKSKVGHYGDFVMHTDWAVGEIQKTLSATGLAHNTLLMVTSDNGSYMYRLDAPECPANLTSQSKKPEDNADHATDPGIQGFTSSHHRANGPWRGTKADIWEGGHHLPFVARWPGKIKPGSQCSQTICHVDLMATVADILDIPLPDNAAEDSFSWLPLFLDRPNAWKRAGVIHHSSNGTFALREGKWKFIAGSGSGGRGKPGSKPWSTPYQLYDMQKDPGETTNLAEQYPEAVQRLTETLNGIIQSGRSRPKAS